MSDFSTGSNPATVADYQKQQQLRQEAARDPKNDRCQSCGGQLAVIAGEVLRGLKPGESIQRGPDGQVRPQFLEVGPDGRITSRAAHKVFLGCGTCAHPVPLDHPRQVELDRQWAEKDQQAKEVHDRAARTPQPPTTPYTELNPLTAAEQRLDVLEKGLAAMQAHMINIGKAIERLTAQMSQIEDMATTPAVREAQEKIKKGSK